MLLQSWALRILWQMREAGSSRGCSCRSGSGTSCGTSTTSTGGSSSTSQGLLAKPTVGRDMFVDGQMPQFTWSDGLH
jgi:hypothetical protein